MFMKTKRIVLRPLGNNIHGRVLLDTGWVCTIARRSIHVNYETWSLLLRLGDLNELGHRYG